MRAHYNTDRTERGVALVAVMLTLLLVSAMAAAIIILANTETNTSSNFKDEQRAFFSAKAGVEEARDRLVTGTAGYTLTTLPTTLPGVGSTGVLYILNPLGSETVAPWCAGSSSSSGVSATCQKEYPDDELCKEALAGSTSSTGTVTCTTDSTTGKKYASGSYYLSTVNASNTLKPSSGPVLDWKWVRITLKQSNAFGTGYYVNGSSSSALRTYWNGNNECTSGVSPCTLPVYVITALAVTPSGSRRMVQMEAAQDLLNFTAPAALTLDGSGDSFTGANSNNYQVSGNDVGGCGGSTTSAQVPAIGVPAGDTLDKTSVITQIDTTVNNNTNKESNYYGSGGTTPDVETVNLPSNMTSVQALQTYVSELKNDVTQPVMNCTSGCSGLSNPGSLPNNPQIIYVNGDLTVSGSTTGGGILIVTGKLTFKGTAEWDGLVLVVGQGNFQMDGTNTFKGAVVVADTLNSSGGTLTVLGGAKGTVAGGGNSNGGIFYSASCLTSGTKLTTYHSISYRELMN